MARAARRPAVAAPTWALVLAGTCLLAPLQARGEYAPAGPEIVVAGADGDGVFRSAPDVAPRPGGGFLVVWFEDDVLRGRAYDAAFAPTGPVAVLADTPVGAVSFHAFEAAAVSADAVVVGWEWQTTEVAGVRLQAFTVTGTALTLPVDVGQNARHPTLAARLGGGFALAWSELDPPAVWSRVYDAAGAPDGPPRLLGAPPAVDPRAAVAPSGEIGVAWQTSFLDVEFVALAADGEPLGPVTALARPNQTYVGAVAVASLADGSFVVAWNGEVDHGPPSVDARRVAAAGALGPVYALGSPGCEESAAGCSFAEPRAAGGLDGDVLVTWVTEAPPLASVDVRHVGPGGDPVGGPAVGLGPLLDGRTLGHDVARTAAGEGVVAWAPDAGFDFAAPIVAQRLARVSPLFADGFESGTTGTWAGSGTSR